MHRNALFASRPAFTRTRYSREAAYERASELRAKNPQCGQTPATGSTRRRSQEPGCSTPPPLRATIQPLLRQLTTNSARELPSNACTNTRVAATTQHSHKPAPAARYRVKAFLNRPRAHSQRRAWAFVDIASHRPASVRRSCVGSVVQQRHESRCERLRVGTMAAN